MIDLDAIQPRTMEFQLGGKAYSVPTLDALDISLALDLVDKDGAGSRDILALFRNLMAEHAPGALEHMTVEQFKTLFGEWQQTGNVGESSPSSD